MLLAYIDEIGSPDAFIHPKHPRYSDSAAFGYGGFTIPEKYARELGAYFANKKKSSFATKYQTHRSWTMGERDPTCCLP